MNIERNKYYAAYHESGHIVTAWIFGEADEAELLDTEENCGRTKYKHRLEEIKTESCVIILVAGPITELRYRKEVKGENVSIDDTKSNDYYRAQQKLGWDPIFDEEEKYAEKVRTYENKVQPKIKEIWGSIEMVANRLLNQSKVTKRELDEMLDSRIKVKSLNFNSVFFEDINT